MAEQRLYHAPNLNLGHLGQALADWYRSQRFEVQLLEAPGGGFVIQARQEEAWRSILGMSATLNVLLRHQQDGNLLVEIGAGKWIDKAAAAGVGMFILWPMLLTAGYGAWQQSQLPQRTFEFIQSFLATGGSVSADMAMLQAAQLDQARRVVGTTGSFPNVPNTAPLPPPATPSMPANQWTPEPAPAPAPTPMPSPAPTDMAAPIAAPAAFCTECGTRLPAGARFCPSCGAKTASA